MDVYNQRQTNAVVSGLEGRKIATGMYKELCNLLFVYIYLTFYSVVRNLVSDISMWQRDYANISRPVCDIN
jgi:hypothetical protein